MALANSHFKSLKQAYIFPVIRQKLAEFKLAHPQEDIVNLGVADVALPLAPSIAQAISTAVLSMTDPLSIQGYGPAEGYAFLRQAIVQNAYVGLGISPEEIFISDGSKSDLANLLDLFSPSCSVAVPDPGYPVYADANVLAGRLDKTFLMPCKEEEGFLPSPPKSACDLMYLCSPHNPTGMALTKRQLQAFVDDAKRHRSILIYDNAYEAFITSADVPKSIYEIPGAREVAIELRSFSKSAGFTGLRCAYLVLPKTVLAHIGSEEVPLHSLWTQRQAIKHNGVSYPIQKGAEAYFSKEGQQETGQQIAYYLRQAKSLKEGLQAQGHTCYGGIDAPYLWWKTPNHLSSWDFFHLLLHRCALIAVPGVGFGEGGEGFVRLSTFSTEDKIKKALERIKRL